MVELFFADFHNVEKGGKDDVGFDAPQLGGAAIDAVETGGGEFEGAFFVAE